ncbi:MAG: hypothetical protein GC160_17920 [Acidobacteria bacterium]|nr:hypothetical protein [Acidobacteriota bacterium]
MQRLAYATLIACLSAGLLLAQGVDIRTVDINSETPDGALLTEAGMAEDPAAKIPPLEKMVAEHPDSPYRGFALFQLQQAYLKQQNNEKVVEIGKKLLEIAPNDLEVHHNVNQALVQLARWDELYPELTATRPIAEKVVAAPKPADEEEDAWKYQVEYATGVTQWLEWATNTALSQQTDPQAQITWMERLEKDYPESQYVQGFEMKRVMAYQQLGDQANAMVWAKKAVDAGERNPALLYQLAEEAYGKEDREQAKKYAEQMLEALEADPPPAGLSPEEIAKWTAYANFVIGRVWVSQNNANGYRTGRSHLLKSVDVLKAEGGPRYHLLAYFLGVCYVQLDIQGDNIKQATFWMKEAARTDGPFKAQAADALKKIGG